MNLTCQLSPTLFDYYQQLGLLKTVECPPTATVAENYALVREALGIA